MLPKARSDYPPKIAIGYFHQPRAALIPANCPIDIEITHPVTCCSVLFHTDFFNLPSKKCQVIALSEVAQNMIKHTQQWGPDTPQLDDHAKYFFQSPRRNLYRISQLPQQCLDTKRQINCPSKSIAIHTEQSCHGYIIFKNCGLLQRVRTLTLPKICRRNTNDLASNATAHANDPCYRIIIKYRCTNCLCIP